MTAVSTIEVVAETAKRSAVLRRVRLVALLLLGGLILYPCVWELLPMGTGSTEYARDWSARLRSTKSIEQAHVTYPEARAHKFSNGDWLLVVSANSHGNPWGGTIVTKDNHGVVRTFFGHVCGSAQIDPEHMTLDEVYEELKQRYADNPELASSSRRQH